MIAETSPVEPEKSRQDPSADSGGENPVREPVNRISNKASVDADEIVRFASIADEWWDPDGKFKPLHQLNPVRLGYVRDRICSHFGRDSRAGAALAGLTILDIGCGGGLLSEPLARQGGTVTGIDPSDKTIRIAKAHARGIKADLTYEATDAESLMEAGRQFDVVIAMEVVEHVNDVAEFVQVCGKLVAPGGLLIASTINRTLKAYGLAIFGAERIMRWLPVGTHHYAKLVRPDELERAMGGGGLTVVDKTGMIYNPLFAEWWLSPRDLDVNYIMSAERPADG